MLNPNKVKTVYICQSCGHKSLRWTGKCPDCEEWNSMVEEKVTRRRTRFHSEGILRAPQRSRSDR